MSPEAKRKTVPITIAKATRGRFKLAGEEMQREVGSSPIGSQELLIELMDYSVIGLNVLRAFR